MLNSNKLELKELIKVLNILYMVHKKLYYKSESANSLLLIDNLFAEKYEL